MRTIKACVFAIMLSQVHGAAAYKESSHARVSEYAVRQSVLDKPGNDVMPSLGLGEGSADRGLPMSLGRGLVTPQALIVRGAIEEDRDNRPLNHFFDPQREGEGLPIPGTKPSPVWALELSGPIEAQGFSYSDAKDFLHMALAGPTEQLRTEGLGAVFESLGHVIHHVQDMSQPQHVRSDDHCDRRTPMFTVFGFELLGSVCEELGRYRPSAYERYVADLGRDLPLTGYVVPDAGNFPTVETFWQHDGRGIAEFASQNFVSVRSNFVLDTSTLPLAIQSPEEHELPRGSAARLVNMDINDPALIRRVTEPVLTVGDISFVETPVIDFNALQLGRNAHTSTLSIWYESVIQGNFQDRTPPSAVFTLNSANYEAAAQFLLPRAAAYSTGLINYFFRGRIEIELPEEGVYGVIDHATTHAAGQGFGKLKLKLSNTSPDGVKPSGEVVPQTMQGGTLVAVAKYTLNSCYLPDLSGDFAVRIDTGEVVYPPCSLDQYFAGEEQISQSAAILAASLDTEAADFEFDFSSQPIPVNARDLRIQVVYTGQLGAEEDGIAFGGRDISEPTHLMIYNNSDYYAVDGAFYTPAQIRADEALSGRVEGLDFDPAALTGVTLAVVRDKPLTDASDPVPVNGYVRAVVLADIEQPFSLNVRSGFERGGSVDSTFPGIWANVTDLRGETAFITPLAIYRGPRTHFVDVVFKANNAVPLADDALTVMSGRDAGDPGPTPIPVRF